MRVLPNLIKFYVLCVRIILLLILQTTSHNSYSQNPERFFIQQIDNRYGLSNSSINNIFKDQDSLLWIATWDGLNMYDGSVFHVYNYGKETSYKTIGSSVIKQIVEDSQHNIWISTMEGVSRFDKHAGKFQNYFYNRSQGRSISEQEYDLAVDNQGFVFCFTSAHGLMYFDAKADSFLVCPLPRMQYNITQLAFDEANRLWLLNSHGDLQAFSGNHGGFKQVLAFQGKQGVTHFFHLNGHLFFATTDNKLFETDPLTLKYKRVMQMDNGLTAMILYQNHYMMAWANKGYSSYDLNFHPSDFLMTEARQVQNIKLTSLAKGSEQILWLGTDGNGMIKIYPRTKSFETVSTAENGNPYNKPVRAFCQENGNLWVGTKGNGIIRIKDFWLKSDIPLKQENFLTPQLDNNAVYSLRKGTDDLIYIGTDAIGIGVYDLKSKKFYKWSSIANHDQHTEFGSVYAMLQDTDRSLWLGTSGYGLIHLKINRNNFGGLSVGFVEKYTTDDNHGGLANDIIYSLAAESNNKLWIGCRYGGLSLLDKRSGRCKTFKAFTYKNSLSNNDVLSLYKDSHDRLWVGTSYGLNWINSNSSEDAEPIFKKLTTTEGLPNNTVHGITEDGLGNIWASTNRGLVQVDPESGKISNYQQIDGLQSNEFCDGAVWRDSFNQLFFGGTSGISFFLPQHISRSNEIPNLLVSGIMMSGKTTNENSFAVMRYNISKPLDFSIERKDNFFELEVKALSFLNAEKCEYAWFMEGYDNIWHYPGTSGKITYSNILPGNYKLKIKWSNGEGAWTPEMTLMTVHVKQYFWLTSWAIVIYTLFVCMVMFMLYRYNNNKLEIKQQLVLEHALRTREEELHQDRISFFTNIAHELQTPLTLIMGSTEVLTYKTASAKQIQEKSHFISMIHQQASKLTYLVHQLMEFRKGESGFFNNRYVNLNISELLQNLAEPFIALGEQNHIRYEILISPDITGWMDKDKLEKIIFNLLSNAFKYTPSREKIVLSVNGDLRESILYISVTNSGCELPKDELDKLFDKFYIAGDLKRGSDKMGTGIGLAFTRQLVLLLNGSIEVSNYQGWLSFNVRLPLFDAAATEKPPEKKQLISGNPSYLFKSITTNYPSITGDSTAEKNKEAIIETLKTGSRKNILIVEDEPEIRFLLRDILQDDYIVSESEDGEMAIGFLQKIFPDLIICDVMMPNMNGLELCNKIKNTASTCHIPIILLSARDTIEQHMEGYEVGADAYIAKPFHTAHLKIRVRKMLEQADKHHQFFKSDQPLASLINADLPPTDKQFLDKLTVIIEEKMDDTGFNAEQIEKILCVSKMQLYRKLKTLTGMTPGEFIRHMRLNAAAQLLVSTQLNVSEIFLRTGFNNQSYFFREFRKRYKAAPNEYRAQHIIQI